MKNLFVVLFVLISCEINAQIQDHCNCDAVLKQGVFSYRYKRGDQKSINAMKRVFSQYNYQEFKSMEGTSAGLDYEKFAKSIGFSYSDNEDEFSKKINKLRNETSIYAEYDNLDILTERFGDKLILEAWSKCKMDCTEELFTISFVPTGSDEYSLKVKYNPKVGGRVAKINDSQTENVKVFGKIDGTPAGMLFPPDMEIRSKEELNISPVNPEKKMKIHFRIEELGNQEIFSVVIPPFVPQFEKYSKNYILSPLEKDHVIPTEGQICDEDFKKAPGRNDFHFTSGRESHCNAVYKSYVSIDPKEFTTYSSIQFESIKNNSSLKEKKDIHKLQLAVIIAEGHINYEELITVNSNQVLQVFTDYSTIRDAYPENLELPKGTHKLTVFFYLRDRASGEYVDIKLNNIRLKIEN